MPCTHEAPQACNDANSTTFNAYSSSSNCDTGIDPSEDKTFSRPPPLLSVRRAALHKLHTACQVRASLHLFYETSLCQKRRKMTFCMTTTKINLLYIIAELLNCRRLSCLMLCSYYLKFLSSSYGIVVCFVFERFQLKIEEAKLKCCDSFSKSKFVEIVNKCGQQRASIFVIRSFAPR